MVGHVREARAGRRGLPHTPTATRQLVRRAALTLAGLLAVAGVAACNSESEQVGERTRAGSRTTIFFTVRVQSNPVKGIHFSVGAVDPAGHIMFDRMHLESGNAVFPAVSSRGEVAVSAETLGGYDVYLIRARGEKRLVLLRALTGGDGSDEMRPSWSSDGSTLAYVSTGAGRRSYVRTLPVHRGSRGLLPHLPATSRGNDPAWSPAGPLLAYVGSERGGPLLTIASPDGIERIAVPTFYGDRLGRPAWSPDGQAIVLEAYGRDSVGLVLVDLRTRKLQGLSPPGSKDRYAQWSPDGNRLAFDRYSTSDSDIVVLDLRTMNETTLASTSADEKFPVWSPDGTAIAFASDRSGNGDIYTVSLLDGTVRQLTVTPDDEFSPVWVDWATG